MKEKQEKLSRKEKKLKNNARLLTLERIVEIQTRMKEVLPGSAECDDLQKALDAQYANYAILSREHSDSVRNTLDAAKVASNVALTGTTIACTFKAEETKVITSKLFGWLPKLKSN